MDNKKENEQNTELDPLIEQQSEAQDADIANIPDTEESTASHDEDAQSAEEANGSGDTDNTCGRAHAGSFVRIGIICGIAMLTLILMLGGWLLMVLHGPSGTAGEEAVLGMRDSSFGRALLSLAMSEDDITAIEERKAARDAIENSELKVLSVSLNNDMQTEQPAPDTDDKEEDSGEDENDTVVTPDEDDDGIELVHIKTENYQGTMLVVDDPKRIFVGVPERYGTSAYGLTLRNMIRKYDAVGGINAGGFEVIGDIQKGGVPKGFVIKDSKIAWGDGGVSNNICGFDRDGKLVVGTMTPNQAIARGVVDAVSFGPALIIDGQGVNKGHWLGVERNARTAIGQRADGTILLLVIEGRHLASFGAYFTEVIDLFLEYGAVNATNLDGGYSTFMVYDEGGLDMHSYAYGERNLPTSILIRKK